MNTMNRPLLQNCFCLHWHTHTNSRNTSECKPFLSVKRRKKLIQEQTGTQYYATGSHPRQRRWCLAANPGHASSTGNVPAGETIRGKDIRKLTVTIKQMHNKKQFDKKTLQKKMVEAKKSVS